MELTKEIKETLAGIGIEVADTDTLDTLKENFGKSYVSTSLHNSETEKLRKQYEKAKEDVDSALGKNKGKVETVIKRVFGEEVKDATDFDDLLKKFETVASLKAAQIEELKQLAEGKSGEALKTIEERHKKELESYKEMLATANTEAETYKTAAETAKLEGDKRVEQYLLNQKVDKHWSEANFVDGTNEFTRSGFKSSKFDGKYTYQIEGDEILLFDLEGNIIKDGTKQMTLKRKIEVELDAANLLKKNNVKSGGNQKEVDTKGKTAQQIEYEKTISARQNGATKL